MYFKHNIYISDGQKAKMRAALNKNRNVKLRIDPKTRGSSEVWLTKRQIAKLAEGRPVDLEFSPTQLKKNGGFLITIPTLLAGLSAAGAIAGATSGVVKAVNEKKHQKQMEQEAKRHNKRIETLMSHVKKGQGAYLPKLKKMKRKD